MSLRTTSNLSAGGVSVSTSVTSDSTQHRSSITDALLCLHESNLMRCNLATPFHYLLKRPGNGDAKELSTGTDTAAAAAAAAATRGCPTSPSRHGSSKATLAQLMVSVLDRVEVRNASRAALFTAMMYVMDGKLLNTRDRAHVLESGVSGRTAAADLVSGRPFTGDVKALASVTATATNATTVVPGATSLHLGYIWMPYFRVSDAIRAFAHLWHRGDFNTMSRGRGTNNNSSDGGGVAGSGNSGGNDGPSLNGRASSSISNRALLRAIEEFTRYPHDSAAVSYTVSVFNHVTRAYEPCAYPLLRSAASASCSMAARTAEVPETNMTLSSPLRSCVGCVMHPCWLDAALQASRHPCGADVYVVTRGHPAEAEERLYVCSVLADITATAQEAAAAISPQPLSTPVEGAGSPMTFRRSQAESASVTATPLAAAKADTLKTPMAPVGVSTRPTIATAAAALLTTAGNVANASVTSPTSKPRRSLSSKPRDANTYVRSDTRDGADGVDAMTRRSLAASKQLLKRRGGEQRYRVRVHACKPVLTPHHFFSVSPEEGLAAARALLGDAAVLLDYYFHVVDGLAATWQGTGDGTASSPHRHSPALCTLHLAAVVPPALRRNTRLSSRGRQFRQRLPYLLFGEDHSAILAAATARAQAMGASPTSAVSSSSGNGGGGGGASRTVGGGVSRPSSSGAASLATALDGAADVSATPSIQVLAAAMAFFCPSAASAACTLSRRIPLALERVLLKVLPMLYLAIFLLTFGVVEADATPAAALEQVYGPWWSQMTSMPSRRRSSLSKSCSTAGVGDGEVGGGANDIGIGRSSEGSVAGSATPGVAVTGCTAGIPPPAPLEESAKLFCRRYAYLGECFHYLAFAYAELPGLCSMSWEACCMALFYLPHDASLWALLASLSERLNNTSDAKTARRVAVQLLTVEEEEEEKERARLRGGGGGGGVARADRAPETSMAPEMADRLSRSALLQHLRKQH